MTRKVQSLLRITLALAGAFILLSCLGFPIPGLDVLAYLLGGWAMFVWRVAPRVRVRWGLVWSTLIYASALCVGAHFFLRWLSREMRGRPWRWRWTLSGLLVVLLMFAAGIASIGVAHQTAWLITSPEPLFKYSGSRERVNRVKCRANLAALGSALERYASANGGRYPDDWAELLAIKDIADDLPESYFVCPSSNDEPPKGATRQEVAADLRRPYHCSYIYRGRGLTEPLESSRVIACDNVGNHPTQGMNVLYGDGRVEWLERAQAEELLQRLRAADGGTTRPTPLPSGR